MRALLLLGLVVAGLLGWFLFRSERQHAGRREPGLQPPASPAGESRPPGAIEPGVAPPALESPPTARAPLEAPSGTGPGEAPARETRELPGSAAPGLRVRVVDLAGTPQVGVPVALLAEVEGAPAAVPVVRATSGQDGIAALEFGSRLKTRSGETSLSVAIDLPLDPQVASAVSLAAGLPTLSDEPLELVLPPEGRAWIEPLRVRVVDTRGLPCSGVSVVFESLARTSAQGSRLDDGVSGADGLVELERTRQLESLGMLRLLQVPVEYRLRVDGPFDPEPQLDLELEPSQEIPELVLPAHGSVVARLRRADGTPVLTGGGVSLTWFRPGEEQRLGWQRREVGGDGLRFESVGLGLELSVSGWLSDGSVDPVTQRRPGPRTAGEVLEFELVLGPPLPLLVGRLLDPGGEPARGRRFGLSRHERNPAPRSPAAGPLRVDASPHETDSEGRFEIPWPPALETAGSFLRFEEQAPVRGAAPDWFPRYVEVDCPEFSADGLRLEVGDLELGELPLLVAGRVLDPSGEGVNQAWLWVRYPGGDPEQADVPWYNLNLLYRGPVATDAEGRFEIRGAGTYPALQVSATRRDLGSSEQRRVPPGTADLTLVLQPDEDLVQTRGSLAGGLLIDPEVPLPELEFSLSSSQGDQDTLAVGGGFRFRNLHPGTSRFRVRTRQTNWTVATVEDIPIRAGGETRDPRLQPLDLRGRLRLLQLRLERSDGRPLGEELVKLRADGQGGQLKTDDQGRLLALVRAADDVLELSVPGHRPLSVGWKPGEQRLRLVPE